MTVKDVHQDPANRTLTVTAEFAAPVDRVWRVWADPRTLERWWGPPTHPATFVDHDLTPGGVVTYYMTGPEGDKYHGWWRVTAVDPGRSLELEDGFGDDPAHAAPDMPVVRMRMTLEEGGPGTVMTMTSVYPTTEAMQKMIDMGMEEGLTLALGQIDGLLAA